MKKLDISNAVSYAARALKGPNIAGADLISLSAKNGTMQVFARSHVMRIKATCECDSELNYECSVKASLLASAIERMPASEVELKMAEGGLLVSCIVAKVTLPVSEYIPIVANSVAYGKPIIVKDLAKYTNQVVHALGNPALHPMMGSVNLKIYDDGGIQITALDGYRLSIRNTANKSAKLSDEFIIYGREFNEALRMIGDDEVAIFKPDTGSFIRLEKEALEIEISLINGEYFNLEKLRDRSFPIHFGINKSELESAIDLARLVSKTARMTVSDKDVILQGQDANGDSQMRIKADVKGLSEGQAIMIAFNAEYLSAALKSIQADDVYVHLRSATTQCCVTDGKNAIEIVLPVRC